MKRLPIALAAVSMLLLASCGPANPPANHPYVSTVSKDIATAQFGAKESKVTLQLFGDFQCPACQRFHDLIEPRLRKDYIDTNKITAVYENYPLPQHQNAVGDALGGLCALSQGKYREYADAMYAFEEKKSNADTSDAERTEVAKGVGVDPAVFTQCLSEGWYVNKLEAEKADGNRLGLDHTPSIYLNGKIMAFSSVDEFFGILDAALAGK